MQSNNMLFSGTIMSTSHNFYLATCMKFMTVAAQVYLQTEVMFVRLELATRIIIAVGKEYG